MTKLNAIVLVLGATLGATALPAQTKAVVNIPFDFTVSSAVLPAGEYMLLPSEAAADVLRIINTHTGESVSVLAPRSNAGYQANPTAAEAVVFHRYGDRRFFSEVWTRNGMARCAMPGKLERESQLGPREAKLETVLIPLSGLK